MDDRRKPPLAVRILILIILMTFFGGGLALFVNLFVPFLNEAAFAILALIIMAEFVVGIIAAKCVQAISALRHATKTSTIELAVRTHDEEDAEATRP